MVSRAASFSQVCVPRSDLAALTLAALVQTGAAWAEADAPAPVPARVVSINLCTDQLAMLLAAPGQLLSVSHLAREPQSSSMLELSLIHI